MNKNLTEVVFIIDESGSMHGLEKDTIGGINSTLTKQKKEEGECLISTIFFNTKNRMIHDRIDIKQVNGLKEDDYLPSGCTALIDAIGDAITHIKKVHKYIREEDVPVKTLFIITTDGMENASTKYTQKEVKEMIESQKEKGWEFIYLAANIDALSSAKEYGISEECCTDYINDQKGNEIKYACMSEAISTIRREKRLGRKWSQKAKEDYKKRK